MSRDSLQTLLIRRSILTVEQIGDALASARRNGGTWLEHLLLGGVIDEERLADWVSFESRVARCDLAALASVPGQVIAQIPAEVAIEHRLVPISLEADGYLQVAMVDPVDELAIDEAEFFSGLRLMRQVALASTVSWALGHYYGATSLPWPQAIQAAAVAS